VVQARRLLIVCLFTTLLDGPQPEPSAAAQESSPAQSESTDENSPDGEAPKPQDDEAPDPPTPPTREGESSADEVEQEQPSFYARIDVDRPDRQYREGESLFVEVVAEQDAHIYVIYEQADGKKFQIFPNSIQRNNWVTAKTPVVIPSRDDQFRWRIGPPFGKEVVRVVASKQPIDPLDDPALREKQANPISSARWQQAVKSLAKAAPGSHAPDRLQITTYPAGEEPPVPRPRRYGAFFGVTRYEFHDEVLEYNEGKSGLNLAGCSNDAVVLGSMLQQMGHLDDVRVYVDHEASRWQMEQAITGWLPAVSRPGDTVFIGFSGHGGTIPDDAADEADRFDEVLLPHDSADLRVFLVLYKRHKAGSLDPRLRPRLEEWSKIVFNPDAKRRLRHQDWQQLADTYVQTENLADHPAADPAMIAALVLTNEALTRHAAVSDDLFGHWLQRLAGRQVVVIIDACHSGGLATMEKSLASANQPRDFDFLSGELGRLKDLGQPQSALLVACGADELSLSVPVAKLRQVREAHNGPLMGWERQYNAFGLMSFYLAQGLATEPRSLTIEQAHAHCRTWMQRYATFHKDNLEKLRRESESHYDFGFEPQLFNFSSRPVLLKP
jgi:hypothetical protein